jgi:hypothetical protein
VCAIGVTRLFLFLLFLAIYSTHSTALTHTIALNGLCPLTGDDTKKLCRNAASYCGILDDKYPDKRPMGFPFDRPPDKSITTLAKFVEKSPNITTTEIRIQFEDRVIRRFPQ